MQNNQSADNNKISQKTYSKMAFRGSDCHLETIFDSRHNRCGYVVRNQDNVIYQDSYRTQGEVWRPPNQASGLLAAGALLLPDKAAPYPNLETLVQRIRSFIHRYVDIPPTYELICTYYVLLTWQYDQFNEVPYLRVRGDFGSGKTRFLRAIGSLTYNPVFASGASTTAPLFHLLNIIRGTLVLDESDYKYSDATAEITKILNNGHAKGFSVLRCEPTKDGGFNARAYYVYGPKILASREGFSDLALESRFITYDFDAKQVRADIPVSLPPSFAQEAVELRNQLLWYRLHRHASINESVLALNTPLSKRSLQISLPLLSLIEKASERTSILSYLASQEAQLRSERGLQTEAELLQIIKQVMAAEGTASLSALTGAFVLRYGQRYSRRITPKWIGYLLRSRLHLATRKSNGVYIISEGQQERLNALYRKFDVTDDGQETHCQRP